MPHTRTDVCLEPIRYGRSTAHTAIYPIARPASQSSQRPLLPVSRESLPLAPLFSRRPCAPHVCMQCPCMTDRHQPHPGFSPHGRACVLGCMNTTSPAICLPGRVAHVCGGCCFIVCCWLFFSVRVGWVVVGLLFFLLSKSLGIADKTKKRKKETRKKKRWGSCGNASSSCVCVGKGKQLDCDLMTRYDDLTRYSPGQAKLARSCLPLPSSRWPRVRSSD